MATLNITVKTTSTEDKTFPEITHTFEAPDTLAAMTERWGEEVIYTLATRMLTTDIQNKSRTMLKRGSTVDDIVAFIDSYNPTEKRARVAAPKIPADPLAQIQLLLTAIDNPAIPEDIKQKIREKLAAHRR